MCGNSGLPWAEPTGLQGAEEAPGKESQVACQEMVSVQSIWVRLAVSAMYIQ